MKKILKTGCSVRLFVFIFRQLQKQVRSIVSLRRACVSERRGSGLRRGVGARTRANCLRQGHKVAPPVGLMSAQRVDMSPDMPACRHVARGTLADMPLLPALIIETCCQSIRTVFASTHIVALLCKSSHNSSFDKFVVKNITFASMTGELTNQFQKIFRIGELLRFHPVENILFQFQS